MGEQNRLDVTDSSVPDPNLMGKLDLTEASTQSRRKAKKPDPVHLTDAEILDVELSFVLSEN
jgi:hypothetical protein